MTRTDMKQIAIDFIQIIEHRPNLNLLHEGKEQLTSCTALHEEPQLCTASEIHENFLVFWAVLSSYFSGCVIKQRARIMVGFDHPTFRFRGGGVTTSPPNPKKNLN